MYIFRTYKGNAAAKTEVYDADGSLSNADLEVSLKEALRATSAAPSACMPILSHQRIQTVPFPCKVSRPERFVSDSLLKPKKRKGNET